MQLLSDIGGLNGIIFTIIGFIVNNVCLKKKTAQYDIAKKAFPVKRSSRSNFVFKNQK